MNEPHQIICGEVCDVLESLPAESIHTVCTSPPYFGLRNYKAGDLEIGQEQTPEEYVKRLVHVFRAVRRVLRPDGTLFLNLGDTYAGGGRDAGNTKTTAKQLTNHASREAGKQRVPQGLKAKDLIGIPWRVALALQADGWWLRSDVIWHKTNPMTESCTDRFTRSHEYIFMLTKSARYFFDWYAVQEPVAPGTKERYAHGFGGPKNEYMKATDERRISMVGHRAAPDMRRKRDVWSMSVGRFKDWVGTSHWLRVTPSDAVCGTRRIASPSCSVHGCSDSLDGEHAICTSVSGNHGNGSYLGIAQTSGPVANSKNRGPSKYSSKSGLRDRIRSRIASAHNKRSHRTALAPSTNPSCNSAAETSSGTACKSELPASVATDPNKRENRTWPDEMDVRLWDQTAYGTVDNLSLPVSPDCSCVYYSEKTKKTSHFATFPEELPRQCILAGTSAGGCCSKCGAPLVRNIVSRLEPTRPGANTKVPGRNGRMFVDRDPKHNADVRKEIGNRDPLRHVTVSESKGWLRSCKCGKTNRVPCTVLDIFAGSGTTNAVAKQLKRRSIGIELNPAYVKLAQERLGQVEEVSHDRPD